MGDVEDVDSVTLRYGQVVEALGISSYENCRLALVIYFTLELSSSATSLGSTKVFGLCLRALFQPAIVVVPQNLPGRYAHCRTNLMLEDKPANQQVFVTK